MLLHKDGLIELNYDVASDILTVSWPNMSGVPLSEISYAFQKLVNTLKYYDVKKLLIDSRKNIVELQDAEYAERMLWFTGQFLSTRLLKVARLYAPDPVKQKRAEEVVEGIKEQLDVPIVFKNFSDEKAALAWLKEA